MKNYIAVTNNGRKIQVKARSYNKAWVAANDVAGCEWIESISEVA